MTSRETAIRNEVGRLVAMDDAVLIGAVRQEALTGVRDELVFRRMKATLRGMREQASDADDHELAAEYANSLTSHGVASGNVGMLVCAVASRLDMPILTTDPDFERYAEHLPITLHELSRRTP